MNIYPMYNRNLFRLEYKNPEFLQLRTFLGNGYQSAELSNNFGQGFGSCELLLSPFPIMRIAGAYSYHNTPDPKQNQNLDAIARALNSYSLIPVKSVNPLDTDLEELDSLIPENFSQIMNMEKAIVETNARINDFDTSTQIFLSRTNPNFGILRMEIEKADATPLTCLHVIRKDYLTKYESLKFTEIGSLQTLSEFEIKEDKFEFLHKGNCHIVQVTGIKIRDEIGNPLSFTTQSSQKNIDKIDFEGNAEFREIFHAECPKANKEGKYRWIVELYFGLFKESDAECPRFAHLSNNQNLVERAKKELSIIMNSGWETELDAHITAWKRDIWDHLIMVPQSDEEHQKRIIACYYVLGCTYLDGLAYGNGPNGITGQGWDGRTFWDHDLWVNIGMVLWSPELARNFNIFRFNTVDGALENRKIYINALKKIGILEQYGLTITEGIKYPWESTSSGLERCPHELGYGATIQEHIVCDVIYGMWLQWIVTQDLNFLEKVAFPVSYASMLYLGQRVNKEADGKWHFRYILPADEFATGGVHDDAFTNLYLDKCLQIVIKWCELIGKSYPTHWNEIVGNMKYHFDSENKRIIEHEEYEDEMIKQADVDLLTWPLEIPFLYQPGGDEIRQNNMLYYYSKLPKDHIMMGACIFSIIAAELKMIEKAWEYFADQFPHFHPEQSYIPSESPTNKCWPFITGIGGFLANLIYGFGGIRFRDEGLMFDPILPNQIPELICKGLKFQGCEFNYRVWNGGKNFSLENVGLEHSITIYCRKNIRFLPEGISGIDIVNDTERDEIKYKLILPAGKILRFKMI